MEGEEIFMRMDTQHRHLAMNFHITYMHMLINPSAHQFNISAQFHLLRDMRLPDGLSQEVVWLAELDGNHDAPIHCFIQVIGTIGGHYD